VCGNVKQRYGLEKIARPGTGVPERARIAVRHTAGSPTETGGLRVSTARSATQCEVSALSGALEIVSQTGLLVVNPAMQNSLRSFESRPQRSVARVTEYLEGTLCRLMWRYRI
jgi:hypothetical protein